MGWRNVAVSLTDRVACGTFSSVVLVSYGQGDFDPPRDVVLKRIEELAKSCGWRTALEMKAVTLMWRKHFEVIDERRERQSA